MVCFVLIVITENPLEHGSIYSVLALCLWRGVLAGQHVEELRGELVNELEKAVEEFIYLD